MVCIGILVLTYSRFNASVTKSGQFLISEFSGFFILFLDISCLLGFSM